MFLVVKKRWPSKRRESVAIQPLPVKWILPKLKWEFLGAIDTDIYFSLRHFGALGFVANVAVLRFPQVHLPSATPADLADQG